VFEILSSLSGTLKKGFFQIPGTIKPLFTEKDMGILELFSLKGRAGYVTGSASGIGRSIAKGLTEAGARVAIVDIDFEKAQKTAQDLVANGCDCLAIHADVTKKRQIQDIVNKVLERWGRLDIVVNNAGKCLNVPAEEMTEEQWKDGIDLNLKAVFLSSQAAGKVMIKQRSGSIVNIASMSGLIVNYPQPQVSYNASKAGVIMMTKSMAAEWAQYGVRVNSISPGYTDTDLLKPGKDLHPIWKDRTPMKRFAEPEEMQGAAIYLASEASRFVTGCNLVVDGGYTLW